jgi:hypothetical protein
VPNNKSRITGDYTKEIRPAVGSTASILGAVRHEMEGLDPEVVGVDAAAAVARAHALLQHAEGSLPQVRCWVVVSDDIFGSERRPTHWSGHATKEEAEGWLDYWDAWCGRRRKMTVIESEVDITSFYEPGSKAPESEVR